jgi:hypothetical protein
MAPFIFFRYPSLFLVSIALAMQIKNALTIEKILKLPKYEFNHY